MNYRTETRFAESETLEKEDSCCFTRLMKEDIKPLPDIEIKPTLVFRKLFSCCRGHYGFADQFGNEYDMSKKPLDRGIDIYGDYSDNVQYAKLRTHPDDDGPAD